MSSNCHVVPPWPVFCTHSCVDSVTLLLRYCLQWQLLVSSAMIYKSRNAWRFWRKRHFFTIIIFTTTTSVVIITIKLCWSLLHIISILTFRFGERVHNLAGSSGRICKHSNISWFVRLCWHMMTAGLNVKYAVCLPKVSKLSFLNRFYQDLQVHAVCTDSSQKGYIGASSYRL